MFHFVLFAYLSFWSLVSFAGFRDCLIYIYLTVYEFSFILLIHHIILLILIYVLSVTFWTLTYYKIYFFWSRTVWYETIELFILWHVWKCFGVLWVNSYQLAVHSKEIMHDWTGIVTYSFWIGAPLGFGHLPCCPQLDFIVELCRMALDENPH